MTENTVVFRFKLHTPEQAYLISLINIFALSN